MTDPNFFLNFQKIESTTQIIDGIYNSKPQSLIYAIFTTSNNAITGSAVCAFTIDSIINAFEGRFKAQKDINSNWLPVPFDRVPDPRPGSCVDDSRTLSSSTVTFVKTHTLMDQSISTFYNRPLLTRLNRLTSIAVDSQVLSRSGEIFDVIFVGTNDGRVFKFINEFSPDNFTTNLISEIQVFPKHVSIQQLTVSKHDEKLIIVGNDRIISIPTHNCNKLLRCTDCLNLNDPYCAWDDKNHECIRFNLKNNNDLKKVEQCSELIEQTPTIVQSTHGTVSAIGRIPHTNIYETEVPIDETIESSQTPMRTTKTNEASALNLITILIALVLIVIGILIGLCFARYRSRINQNFDNQLNWAVTHPYQTKSRHIPPRDKDINLLMNATQTQMQQPAIAQPNNKKDNIDNVFDGGKDRTHECKNSTESLEQKGGNNMGTLQKVKKTYI